MAVVGWRGVGVSVAGDDTAVSAVLEQLPPFFGAVAGAPVGSADLVVHGDWLQAELPDDLTVGGPVGAETFRAAASRVELLVVSHLDDLAVVHAGVVAHHGRTVVVPGTSMAGKSTLVRAMVDLGATYWSDEFALLEPDGRVRPYPRRMTTRTATGTERHQPERSATVDAEPLPVGVLAAVRYADGAAGPEPLSAAEAVMTLLANAVNARRQPELCMAAFSAAALAAHRLGGTRVEAEAAARDVLDLLEHGRSSED